MNTKPIRTIQYHKDSGLNTVVDHIASTIEYSTECVGVYPVCEFAVGDYRTPWGRLISAFIHVAEFMYQCERLNDGDLMTYDNSEGQSFIIGIAYDDYWQGDDMKTIPLDNVPGYKLVIIKKYKLVD